MLENIGFEVEYGAESNPNFDNCDVWTCDISYEGRLISIAYYMGYGHGGAEPTLEMVLDSCLSDANALCMEFNEWCSEYGYNDDSIRDLNTYNDCRELGRKLQYLFGGDYEAIEEAIGEICR